MRKWTFFVIMAMLWLLGACALSTYNFIREVTDSGCQISEFKPYITPLLPSGGMFQYRLRIGVLETSTGPRGLSAIIVECK